MNIQTQIILLEIERPTYEQLNLTEETCKFYKSYMQSILKQEDNQNKIIKYAEFSKIDIVAKEGHVYYKVNNNNYEDNDTNFRKLMAGKKEINVERLKDGKVR